MSVTRTIVINLCFYALCLFYGFVVTLRLLLRFAFRGRRQVMHVKPRSSPPACLHDARLGHHDYVKLKHVTLHFVETGDRSNNKKPLLLCLHGFPEFWYSWRYQLQEFRNEFWVVAVDMRGYGESDKPSGIGDYAAEKLIADIEQMIHALGRTSCVLMGHDQGGIIAWMFAEKYPQMVDRLIVLNAAHPDAFFRLLRSSVRQCIRSWFLFFAQLPYLPELYMRCDDLKVIDVALRSRISSSSSSSSTSLGRCEHDVETYKHTFGSPGALTAPLNYFRNLRSSILYGGKDDDDDDDRVTMTTTIKRKCTGQVTMPVLILWGAEDARSDGDRLARESRERHVHRSVECTVHLIKGAGRFIQQDRPDIVNKYIREFLIDIIKASNSEGGSGDASDVSLIGRSQFRDGWPLSLTDVRKRLASSVSFSALKLTSRIPILVTAPILGQLTLKNKSGGGDGDSTWMGALNRKLLST